MGKFVVWTTEGDDSSLVCVEANDAQMALAELGYIQADGENCEYTWMFPREWISIAWTDDGEVDHRIYDVSNPAGMKELKANVAEEHLPEGIS